MGECDSVPTAGISASAIADVFAATTCKNGVSASSAYMAGSDAAARGWECASAPTAGVPASATTDVFLSMAGDGTSWARIPGRCRLRVPVSMDGGAEQVHQPREHAQLRTASWRQRESTCGGGIRPAARKVPSGGTAQSRWHHRHSEDVAVRYPCDEAGQVLADGGSAPALASCAAAA